MYINSSSTLIATIAAVSASFSTTNALWVPDNVKRAEETSTKAESKINKTQNLEQKCK